MESVPRRVPQDTRFCPFYVQNLSGYMDLFDMKRTENGHEMDRKRKCNGQILPVLCPESVRQQNGREMDVQCSDNQCSLIADVTHNIFFRFSESCSVRLPGLDLLSILSLTKTTYRGQVDLQENLYSFNLSGRSLNFDVRCWILSC